MPTPAHASFCPASNGLVEFNGGLTLLVGADVESGQSERVKLVEQRPAATIDAGESQRLRRRPRMLKQRPGTVQVAGLVAGHQPVGQVEPSLCPLSRVLLLLVQEELRGMVAYVPVEGSVKRLLDQQHRQALVELIEPAAALVAEPAKGTLP
jgi:hypothetical protein